MRPAPCLPVTAALVLLTAGCITIRPQVVDSRTALENQVVGELQSLGDDLILVSSVRQMERNRADGSLSGERIGVLRAVMNQTYREDDIAPLKRQGIVGERLDGLVAVANPRALEADATLRTFVERLVLDENADREVVLLYIARRNGYVRGSPETAGLRQAYHRLCLKSSPPGTPVERAGGGFGGSSE